MTIQHEIPNTADLLIGTASVPYTGPEQGQDPAEGFDCSGFATFVLEASGVDIGTYIGRDGQERPIRHSNEYWDHFGVFVHEGSHVPGDLIFFSRNGYVPTHMGIVADNETYIHAPGRVNTHVQRELIPETTAIVPRIESNDRQLYLHNPIGFKAVTCRLEWPTDRFHQRLLSP